MKRLTASACLDDWPEFKKMRKSAHPITPLLTKFINKIVTTNFHIF
jgi:hypothetical protein